MLPPWSSIPVPLFPIKSKPWLMRLGSS
jgi:hypothetical protein